MSTNKKEDLSAGGIIVLCFGAALFFAFGAAVGSIDASQRMRQPEVQCRAIAVALQAEANKYADHTCLVRFGEHWFRVDDLLVQLPDKQGQTPLVSPDGYLPPYDLEGQ
jgi:hypothetical protein